MSFGLIGHPVSHSLSPLMHSGWLQDTGISGTYQAVDIAPDQMPDLKAIMADKGIKGFNVTVPHKEAVFDHLDRLAPQARKIGAVNTVRIEEDGSWVGFNTDGLGFLAPLTSYAGCLTRPALVMGAGGAARAVVAALMTTDVPLVMINNRSKDRAEALAKDLGSGRASLVDSADLQDAVAAAGLIVNTTSLGMTGKPDLALSLETAARDCLVYDLVYAPLETTLLKDAANRGFQTLDGLDMLIGQGAAAFKIWTGIAPETQQTRTRLVAHLTQ